MLARRRELSAWVAREILPYEPKFRAVLLRSRLATADVDEVMQEAYYRLFSLDSFDHIDNPRAYFFSIARNLVTRRLMAREVVSIEAIAGLETFADAADTPEQALAARMDYDRLMTLIAGLPERCRKIVELRKIEGWSQRQIAEHMGMTQKAVEKQVWRGVKALREAWGRHEEPRGDAMPLPRAWRRGGTSA